MTAPADIELNQQLLSYSESKTIQKSLQNKIARRLWEAPLHPFAEPGANLEAYFADFQQEINLWSVPKQKISIDSYRDFLQLAKHLTECKHQRRDSTEILQFFPAIKDGISARDETEIGDVRIPVAMRYEHTTQEEVDNAIELTVGLWLMVYMGPSKSDIFLNHRRRIDWPAHLSLVEVIDMHFDKKPPQPASRTTQFPKNFNARNLERIGEINITWTRSLENHLAFNDETMTVALYHHVSILDLHEKIEKTAAPHAILPAGLAAETRRTLALLLPSFDIQTKRWFERKRAGVPIDARAASQTLGARRREIESFAFWGQRLSVIAEAFDNVEPRGFKAWWFDRRNGVQWSNFWLAMTVLIFTAVFGMVSAVTGIVQVYYAGKGS